MTELLLQMLSKLTGAYNKKPDSLIGRLFQLFSMGLGGAQNALQAVSLMRDIEQAYGRTLDRLGQNFGVSRAGASDKFYRLMIKTKVTALISGGDVDTIINATSVLFNIPPSNVEIQENYPAKVRVVLDEASIEPEYVNNAQITAPVVKRIIAAGVGKEVFFRRSAEAAAALYTGIAYLKTVTINIPADDTANQ